MADDGAHLENKIVLAIAIRLLAEKFVIDRIADPAFVATLTANQTRGLSEEFKARFPDEDAANSVLDRVGLMTPENIHVNSLAQLVSRMRHLVTAAARQARSLAPGARPTRWNQLR